MKNSIYLLLLAPTLAWAQPKANGKYVGTSTDGKHIIEHIVEQGATSPAAVAELYKPMGLIFQPHLIARRNGFKNNEELGPVGVRIFLYTEQPLPPGFPKDSKWGDKEIILHELKEGDVLYQIKKKYYPEGGVTVDSIIQWNDLKDAGDVGWGQYIILLKPKAKPAPPKIVLPYAHIGTDKGWSAIEYKVQKEMTDLDKIAAFFTGLGVAVTGKQLRRWNGYYESENTQEGIRIFIFTKDPLPTTIPSENRMPGKKFVIHEVIDGETLYSIRRKYYGERPAITLEQIVEWNDLLGVDDVAIGQFLILYTD